TKQMLQAMYGSTGAPLDGQVATAGAIPPGWTDSWNSKELYTNVVGPYCRTCHISREAADSLSFATSANFSAHQGGILTATCGSEYMPHSEQAQRNFWSSGARSHLLAWSGATGDCTPH